ncbi:hypothetical protein [Intestinimonas butyriciproducens]|uniref:Uncharacterized protein n=1 Tax=Intestinimonas butyriciproducens TaxID=1297617 RepID=A0A0S2W7F5_9FIRM|nr:hypothetical protein [Intestinimonas butyriciproducens]ALP95186.1 hypothetical protein IB211_02795 [Intestinimonas butyriciproducens]
MKYVIDSKTYENHINDEVHLYGLLHQLAFLAGKVKDERDMENLLDTAKRYGEIAEEKFAAWCIPGRYLVFGDRADLAELKAAELTPLTDVLKAHDRERAEKERAAEAGDPAYIISASDFRMLVGDLHDLFVRALATERHLTEAETEKDLRRIQKRVSGYERWAKRLCRSWQLPKDGSEAWGRDTLEDCLRKKMLKPYEESDGFGGDCCCDLCGDYSCYDDYDL